MRELVMRYLLGSARYESSLWEKDPDEYHTKLIAMTDEDLLEEYNSVRDNNRDRLTDTWDRD